MLCALGVAAVLEIAAGSRPAPAAHRQALMWKLGSLDRQEVRRALGLAVALLASPGCRQVYSDFELPEGGTPQGELDRKGIGPREFLETLVFTDGSREPVCGRGKAALTTRPETGLIFVCPLFAWQSRRPQMSAVFIIHESLHALGLGENPPSSDEITRRIMHRCW
jgi:hypothetical protein